ncbi:MAG: hypothetical protein Ct9H300mP12_07750 [Acidimicrobiales bacterium]|nr:MAG: hypothetical protein Ct9H300mP12_07750 [Acidimicrobiales bacterium]
MTVPRGPDEVRTALVDRHGPFSVRSHRSGLPAVNWPNARGSIRPGAPLFGGKGALLSEGWPIWRLRMRSASELMANRGTGGRPSRSQYEPAGYLRAIAFASIAGEMDEVSTIHPWWRRHWQRCRSSGMWRGAARRNAGGRGPWPPCSNLGGACFPRW